MWRFVGCYSSPHFSFFATSMVTMIIHAISDASERIRSRPVGRLASQRPISMRGTVGIARVSCRSVGWMNVNG